MLCVLQDGGQQGQDSQNIPLTANAAGTESNPVEGVEGVEGVVAPPQCPAAQGQAGTGTNGSAKVLRQASFNALFSDPVQNRPQICLALHDLVARVARRVEFPSAQSRVELSRDIYLHCLEILGQYNPAIDHAHHWFALAARRKFWQRIHQERRRTRSLSVVDHDSTRLRPMPQVVRRHQAATLIGPRAGASLVSYLDGLLQRAVTRHGQAATDAETHLTRGMVLALQEVRHRVAGAYRPIAHRDLVYTKRHRVERGQENDESIPNI